MGSKTMPTPKFVDLEMESKHCFLVTPEAVERYGLRHGDLVYIHHDDRFSPEKGFNVVDLTGMTELGRLRRHWPAVFRHPFHDDDQLKIRADMLNRMGFKGDYTPALRKAMEKSRDWSR